jgi:tRNA1Val (adenine37-N6)-methyltransferase
MSDVEPEEPTGWPSDAAADRLIGDWVLYQRRGGHRTSTDDMLTAWFAIHRHAAASGPGRYLDLGCGVGSVLLMTAHRLKPGRCLGVEAQTQSVLMARRSVQERPPGGPDVEIVQSDLRDFDPGDERFELVTGSPPYFPIGTGILPDDAQRRACRFEVRGGVESYCETAARCLTATGRFYMVFQTKWDDRVLAAAEAAGLHITARVDARMREDREEPFLAVYEMSLKQASLSRFELSIRDVNGKVSPDYLAARRDLGVE